VKTANAFDAEKWDIELEPAESLRPRPM